jgi:tetraacyldisaccharide 4'-kinase
MMIVCCPQGNLKRTACWCERASIVIVTKCPEFRGTKVDYRTRLKVTDHQIIFPYINYDSYFFGFNCKINRDTLKGVKV